MKLQKGKIMRKNNLTNVIVTVVFVLIISMSFGCGNKYSAVIVESELQFTNNFLKNSITYGAYYRNENFNSEKDEWDEEWLYDTVSPKTRTYIIGGKFELNEIFSAFPKVDLEKEMVIVYCYTSCYGRSRILKDIQRGDDLILKIKFTIKKGRCGYADASMPQRRILVLKMDKLEVKSVEFEYIE